MENFLRKNGKLIFLVAYTVVFLFLFLKLTNFDVHNRYGDAQSLTNVMFNGDVITKGGFEQNSVIPKIPRSTSVECCTSNYYAGFPPLVNWLGGIISAGGTDLAKYRIFSGVIAYATMWVFFLAISRIFSPVIAGLTVVVAMSFQPFWATFVTQIYNLADLWCWVTILMVAESFSNGKKPNVVCLGILFFLNAMTSYEYVVFALIMCGVLYWNENIKTLFNHGVVAVAGALSAITVKIFLSALQKESWSVALKEQYDRILLRTLELGSEVSAIERLIGGMANFPSFLMDRLNYHYGEPIMLFLVLVTIASLGFKDKVFLRVMLAMIFGSVCWVIIFPQHTLIHINSIVNRHWIYVISLVIALGLYEIGKLSWRGWVVVGSNEERFSGFISTAGQFFLAIIAIFPIFSFLTDTSQKFSEFYERGYANTWEKELMEVRELCNLVPSGAVCVLQNRQQLRASFLHQPPTAYQLEEINYVVDSLNEN